MNHNDYKRLTRKYAERASILRSQIKYDGTTYDKNIIAHYELCLRLMNQYDRRANQS